MPENTINLDELAAEACKVLETWPNHGRMQMDPAVVLELIAMVKRAETKRRDALNLLASTARHLPYVQGADWPKDLYRTVVDYLKDHHD